LEQQKKGKGMKARMIVNMPRRFVIAFAASLVVAGNFACGSTGKTIAVTGVTLEPSILNLAVGDSSVALVATVSPSNATNTAVSWRSSDPAVALVSDTGVVSPIEPGTATITATTVDGAKTATCAVTIVSSVVAVERVSLDKSTLNLVAGGAAVRLTATITPSDATSKNLLWQSRNAKVATVSESGDVTPLAAGYAEIVVKSADGSKIARCSVVVAPAPIAVTNVTLDKKDLNLVLGFAGQVLVATVSPENATDKAVLWTSDNPKVATVNENGLVTGVAEGQANIIVKTKDGAFTASCRVTVKKLVNKVTGVALSEDTIKLAVGGSTKQLTATVSPQNADYKVVEWITDTPEVATVKDGIVTPVASGVAKIEVKTLDGGFIATCQVTVRPDAVTLLKATYPITGQIALTWTDPKDVRATNIKVTRRLAGSEGILESRIVLLGQQNTVFTDLEVGTDYEFSIQVLGSANTLSDQTEITATPEQVVVKVLSRIFKDAGVDYTVVLTDTNGSGAGETHDLVMAKIVEIHNAPPLPIFPKNYRWVLMPGLADPADSSLVSFRNQQYNGTQWVDTDRYMHIREGGYDAQDQYYAWCNNSTPKPTSRVAHADPLPETPETEEAIAAFKKASTFKKVLRSETQDQGKVYFQWMGDESGESYITHLCFHIVAMDAVTLNRPDGKFWDNADWVISDVTEFEP
jgi:uncharacterized protein YjdB